MSWCSKATSLGLASLALLIGFPVSSLAYNGLVAFGDSYTDTGNLPSPAPDYWNGRFSNGPLWIEYLSSKLGLTYDPGNNFAVSGDESTDLGTQINNFPGTTDSDNVIFVLWAGNNDFVNHLSLGTKDSAWNMQITNVVFSLTDASDLLYQKGARDIIIFNQLDVTRLPAIRNHYSSSFRTYLLGKVKTCNSRLAAAIPSLISSHPGLHVYLYDIYSDFNYLLDQYLSYGFTDTTVGALDSPTLPDTSFTGAGANYVFWDAQHPTTKAHELIAGWVAQLLPPPPSLPSISLVAPAGGSTLTAPAIISLSASVSLNGFNLSQVDFLHDGVLLGQTSTAPYTFTWSGVPAGSYLVSARLVYDSGQTVTSAPVQVSVVAPAGSALPLPWLDADIGAVGQPGSGSYNGGIFTLSGSGSDIWGPSDGFHFVYQQMNGDGTIVARVTAVQNTDGFAKAGLMLRGSLDPAAANAMEFLTPASGTGFQWRAAAGGSSAYTAGTTATAPVWLKLERVGNIFNGYSSLNAATWKLERTTSITMGSQAYVGLAVTSHNNSKLNTSVFDQVQVRLAVPSSPAPPPNLSLSQLSDGSIQLKLTGSMGDSYKCEASADLLTWTAISTNLNTTGTVLVTEPKSAAARVQFYRASIFSP